MKIKNKNQQLELSIANTTSQSLSKIENQKSNISAWWFARMRHLVNRALDWRAAPIGRPEQIWFPNHQHHLAE